MNDEFFNDRGEGCWVMIKWGPLRWSTHGLKSGK